MKEIKIERSITRRSYDSLERYLQELSGYPLLGAEEEALLARKIRSGDEAAFQTLVERNLRFVVSVAKKYEMTGMPLADLVSEGNLGLIKAAGRFDETRGFKFISYAVWWIRQSILHSIAIDKRMIRLPSSQLKGLADLLDAIDVLEQRLQRSPALTELSQFMNLPSERILDYLSYSDHTYSFDSAMSEEDQGSKVGNFCDSTCVQPDYELERDALQVNMELMMAGLNARERKVLRLAYGMDGGRPLENVDIGHQLGISAETVRRTKGKVLSRLQADSAVKMMREYL